MRREHADRVHGAMSPSKQELLGGLYPIPNRLNSEEECERFEHRDLPSFSLAELEIERQRVIFRLIHDDAPSPWLESRLDAVEEAIRRGR